MVFQAAELNRSCIYACIGICSTLAYNCLPGVEQQFEKLRQTTLETSAEDVKLHSKRVEKMQKYTRNKWNKKWAGLTPHARFTHNSSSMRCPLPLKLIIELGGAANP